MEGVVLAPLAMVPQAPAEALLPVAKPDARLAPKTETASAIKAGAVSATVAALPMQIGLGGGGRAVRSGHCGQSRGESIGPLHDVLGERVVGSDRRCVATASPVDAREWAAAFGAVREGATGEGRRATNTLTSERSQIVSMQCGLARAARRPHVSGANSTRRNFVKVHRRLKNSQNNAMPEMQNARWLGRRARSCNSGFSQYFGDLRATSPKASDAYVRNVRRWGYCRRA